MPEALDLAPDWRNQDDSRLLIAALIASTDETMDNAGTGRDAMPATDIRVNLDLSEMRLVG
ncbi:hypothetical protein [Mesorhizobium sp. SP-1A]|jgi:hypothetical protein|uniref:hypothetical protein n=1 Tax=Mesorhizobium sp. SP-1A TaxID=3077840 RepID=UPI0028F6E660|nr:hypothetical protein [Mesorhizobium sp. SP-1A]